MKKLVITLTPGIFLVSATVCGQDNTAAPDASDRSTDSSPASDADADADADSKRWAVLSLMMMSGNLVELKSLKSFRPAEGI
jgi:hypothetical protein